MKRIELQAHFNRFYNQTYPKAMAYCMAQTGDFLNGEDLLAEAYYVVYRRFMNKKTAISDPEGYLLTALDNQISKYWKKRRKELEVDIPLEKTEQLDLLLETELALTEEKAMKQMLVHDVLEFVSVQPPLMRRAFAVHFYLGKTIEETAAELGISVAVTRNYLYSLLKMIQEEFLEDLD